MRAFAAVLHDEGPTVVKFSSRVTPTEAHTLQTHVVTANTVVSHSIPLIIRPHQCI